MDISNKLKKYMITDDFIKEINKSKMSFSFQTLQKQPHLKRNQKGEIQENMSKTIVESNEIYSEEDNTIKKEEIFYPKDKDTLFWCFYIIVNGIVKYEMCKPRNIVVEKKIKFEYIEKIRKNKDALKIYKFASLQHVENSLANDSKIDAKTFFTLCVIENINIFYIKNKTFYQHLMNNTDLIYQIHHLESDKFGFKISSLNECETYRNQLYKLDNIDKPIMSSSAYKVQDLIEICNKLGIETIDKETNKTKTKNKLYESIVLYF
jgi:hypothetical protein